MKDSQTTSSRRTLLKNSTLLAASGFLPAQWCRADEITPSAKLKLRFAVASDLHYGQKGTPFAEMADDLVTWINREKEAKGLDFLFLNGDLTHDLPSALLDLRDKHLSKLEVPYYAGKGNHDFIDQKPGSPTESWEKIWGYPANHTITRKDFIFVMADTSAPQQADIYLAADLAWLRGEFQKHRDAPAIFSLIHIPQRKHQVEGWPKHGVHDDNQIEKAEAVMTLLESTKNLRGIFHGHNHHELGMYLSGEKRYFFDSHVGGSWGADKGYRIVEIYEDHKMLTYQMNGTENRELNRHDLPV